MSTIDRISHELVSERAGLGKLGFASFLESTIVPIPLEILIIPLMAAHPRRAVSIAHAIFIGCLVGATLFYFVGNLLFEPVVQPALQWLGLMETYRTAVTDLQGSNLFWAVFLVSLSPAPFQLATLGAGATAGNFALFIAGVAASRAIRYYGLALLAVLFGERLLDWVGGKTRLIAGTVLALATIWVVASFIL